jgi:hypothetical protein
LPYLVSGQIERTEWLLSHKTRLLTGLKIMGSLPMIAALIKSKIMYQNTHADAPKICDFWSYLKKIVSKFAYIEMLINNYNGG